MLLQGAENNKGKKKGRVALGWLLFLYFICGYACCACNPYQWL